MLACISDSNGVMFASFSAHTGQCIHSVTCQLEGNLHNRCELELSPTGQYAYVTIATHGSSADVPVLDVSSGTVLFSMSEVMPEFCSLLPRDSLSWPRVYLSWSAGGTVVVTSQGVCIIGIEAGACTPLWTRPSNELESAWYWGEASPNGFVLSTSRSWEGCMLAEWRVVNILTRQERLLVTDISSFSFSPDITKLVGCAMPDRVQMWDLNTKHCLLVGGSKFVGMSPGRQFCKLCKRHPAVHL